MSYKQNDNKNLSDENWYRSIYENSPDLFRTINTKGEIINCNKSYSETLGYSKTEIFSQTIFDHTAKESISEMRKTFEEWKSCKIVTNSEIWLKKKNGDKFLALLSANNLYDKNGILLGSNTILRDITKITAMKKEFKNLKRVRQEIMGEIAIRIAHDLKNPLSVIKNSIQLIQFKNDPALESYSDVFNRVDHAINRMDHQINEVLEFVNPLPMILVKNSLKDIIENVIEEMIDPNKVIISLPSNDIVIRCDAKK